TAEAGEVRGPETFLALAMKDGDVVELTREPVGDLTGPVRRVVVDHEDTHAPAGEGAQHRLDVLPLVVGGQADGRVHMPPKAPLAVPPSGRVGFCPRVRLH